MWEAVIEFIKSLKFFTLIPPNEQGVYLRCGKLKKKLECGFYWQCPIIDEIYSTDVMPQILDLRPQNVTTKDNYSIVIGGAINYSIDDIYKASYLVEDFDKTLCNLVLIGIVKCVRKKNLVELDTEAIGDEVGDYVSKRADEWGIVVTEVAITDLARNKVISLTGLEQIGRNGKD